MRRCVHQLSHPIGYMINISMFFTTSIFVATNFDTQGPRCDDYLLKMY